MSHLLISYRYSLFALFLVFNAIICSVAVWNYTIARALLLDAQVDVYIAVIAALGFLFIIPVTYVDVFRKNAFVSRVWFELVWIGTFWVLELCGASAFTALLPDTMCTTAATNMQRDSCTSSRALEAMTWISTIMLLIYLIVLFVCAILHYDDDQSVWQAGVRFYPWFGARSTLGSAPPSPTKAGSTWQRKSLKLVAPQPKRPTRPADLDIESGTMENKSAPAPPSMQQVYRVAVTAPHPVASMYPAPVAATMGPTARALPRTGTTPPPLGNWPRPIHMQMQKQSQQPPRRPRLPIPAVAPIPEVSSPLTAPALTMTVSPEAVGTPRAAGPSGRRGSGSPVRRSPPPPLDLTKISAYNAIEERRKQLR